MWCLGCSSNMRRFGAHLVLLATLFTALVAVQRASAQCPLPTESEINSILNSVLVSLGAEDSSVTATINDTNFACLAIDSRERYSFLSVAIAYFRSDTGTRLDRIQLQLQCSAGVLGVFDTEKDPLPGAFTQTRRDCRVCANVGNPDPVTKCLSCPSSCSSMGQGFCRRTSQCCPFFSTDGSCVTECPPNTIATPESNFTCAECAQCPIGTRRNTTCGPCIPEHICLINDPCQNGGRCNIGENSNTNYTCSCTGHFSGRNCTDCVLPCPLGYSPAPNCTTCIPQHICLTNDPCENGGTCVIVTAANNDYTCTCPSGTTGRNCSRRLGMSPCVINGGTVLEGDSVVFVDLNRPRLHGEFVFLMDESPSLMSDEFNLPAAIEKLDEGLKRFNIGTTVRNRYGIFGFSSPRNVPFTGRLYRGPNNEQFVNYNEIGSLLSQLTKRGRAEDGYAAVEQALDQYLFTDGARQFLLITDEDRYILNASLTREPIRDHLMRSDSQLNVFINEKFRNGRNFYDLLAMGVYRNNSYIFNPLSAEEFNIGDSPFEVPNSGHGTTNFDYTELALQVGGSAWSLPTIDNDNTGFLESLVSVVAEEIIRQKISCMNCTCMFGEPTCFKLQDSECDIEQAVRSIVPLPQPLLQTLRVQLNTSYKFVESSITIECRLSNTQGRFNWTFQGKRLPSNAIIVNERSRSLLQINNFNYRNNGMYTCFAATGSGATLAEGQKSVYLEERPHICSINNPCQNGGTCIMDSGANNYTCNCASGFIGVNCTEGDQDPTTPPTSNTTSTTPIPLSLTVDQSSIMISSGQNATFMCSSNTPVLQLSWEYFFTPGFLPANAISRQSGQEVFLTITNFNIMAHSGPYICRGTIDNMIASSRADLIPTGVTLELPSISPSNANIPLGTNTVFTCTSSHPAVHRWEFRNGALPPNVTVNIVDSRRTELVVTNFMQAASGQYRCTTTLGSSSTARVAFLGVQEMLEISVSPVLVNTTAAAIRNEAIVFECRLVCTCAGTTVRWMTTSSGVISPATPGRISRLTISDPQFSATGQHTCVTQGGGDLGSVMKSVTLIIRDVFAPVSISVMPMSIFSEIGASVTLDCRTNRNATRFQWFHRRLDNTQLPPSASFRSPSGSNENKLSQLVVSSVSSTNIGVYFCRAFFEPTVTATASGVVVADPLGVVISEPRTNVYVCNLSCSCAQANVQWFFGSSSNLPTGASQVIVRTRRRSTLTISSVNESTRGVYTCRATQPGETDTDTVTVV